MFVCFAEDTTGNWISGTTGEGCHRFAICKILLHMGSFIPSGSPVNRNRHLKGLTMNIDKIQELLVMWHTNHVFLPLNYGVDIQLEVV